jgi:4-amino-4-deoxy-L-arabinose transferase-like glycosyltransferase
MLNKPPLHAWLIALASLPGGEVTRRTAALPSAVAGIAVVLVTAMLGARWFGVRAGFSAGFMTATTVGVFTLARSPAPDMTLTLATTAAMAALGAAELEGSRPALIAFYALTGLGFLAKGPAGLIPIASGVTYEILMHGRKGPARLASLPGAIVLLLLTVPWPLLALQASRHQFVHDVLTKEMEANYLGARAWQWQHVLEPFRQAIVVTLPWSLLAPVAIWTIARAPGSRSRRPEWLAVVWAATSFVLVALSERQRARYYLPLCPPVALLVGAWYHGARFGRRVWLAGTCAVVIAAGFIAGERHEMDRRNRLTDVSAIRSRLDGAAGPVFAVDTPELVFGYYLDRPILPLFYFSQFEKVAGHGYVIVSDRFARSVPASVPRLATSRVNGRTFVLMGK